MTGEHPEDPAAAYFGNTVDGDMSVGAQTGQNYGTINAGNFYQKFGDRPEDLFAAGRNHLLLGGVASTGERLIGDAYARGLRTPEVRYYYALATLSGRGLEALTPEQEERVDGLFAQAEGGGDGWSAATGVLRRLVGCLRMQEAGGAPGAAASHDAVGEALAALPGERADEIRHRLEPMLAGALRDRLESSFFARVCASRMSRDRERRVPLYFEPDPEPPRPLRAPPPRVDGCGVRLLLGGLAVSAALGVALRLLVQPGGLAVLAVVPLLAAAGAAVRAGLALGVQRDRRQAWDRRLGPGEDPGDGDGDVRYAQARDVMGRFTAGRAPVARPALGSAPGPGPYRNLLDAAFREHAPADPPAAAAFLTDTAGLRATLEGELTEQYGPARGGTAAARLRWLADRHARDTVRAWESGGLRRPDLAVDPRLERRFGLALIVAGVSAAWTLAGVADATPLGAFAVAALAGVGGWAGWTGGSVIHRERRRYHRDVADLARRFAAEERAHAEWLARLKDRPSEQEMTDWLDADKAYLRSDAIRRNGLAYRDVVTSFVLSDRLPGARAVRLAHGPARYSHYRITVFLLTEGGLRQSRCHLDFATGITYDERRTEFAYQSIVTARAAERGARHPLALPPDGRPEDPDGRLPRERIRRLTLDLHLMAGEPIRVSVEDYAAFVPVDTAVDEDDDETYAIARDVSGAANAQRILEAVAAEGPEWVANHRARARRRLRRDEERAADGSADGSAGGGQAGSRAGRGSAGDRNGHGAPSIIGSP